MQACSLGGGDSLGSHGPPPLVLASPNTKHKLLLLERRLTGSCHAPSSSNQAAATAAADASTPGLVSAGSADMLGEAVAGAQAAAKPPVEVVVIPDTQEDDVMHPDLLAPAAAALTAPPSAAAEVSGRRKSPTPPSSDEVPASAAKRRKTGKPQHRPTADAATGSAAAAAAAAAADSKAAGNSLPGHTASAAAAAAAACSGRDLVQQRDKPAWVRAAPRSVASPAAEGKSVAVAAAAATAAAAVAEPGNSNPPMSPIAGGGLGMPLRTPRSSSKQQAGQQQHGKGQTNISQFFPSLTDGNSRDSETASLQHQPPQPHQQQQQPSPLKDTADQQQQRLVAASARGTTPPPSAAAKTAAAPGAGDGSMQQQSKRGRGAPGAVQGGSSSSDAGQAVAPAAAWQQQLAALQQKHQQELEQARQEARQREGQLAEQLLCSQRQIEGLQGLLTAARCSSQQREGVVQSAVSQLVVQLAVAQGNLSRLQMSLDGSRLGGLGLARNGALGFAEVWEDGPVLRELASRKVALQRSREEVEAARKVLKKRLPPPPKATLAAAAAAAAAAADAPSSDAATAVSFGSSAGSSQYISSAEYVMQDEILKVRLSVLRREEELLAKEEERLSNDKMRHLRLLKRLRDEEGSRFQGQPVLHQRYVLLALLGRGGFSEVHKAYDLVGLKFVAVKIHQLNSTWSESRKSSYVRHAVREYTIHKALRHNNIVSLTDIFEVDNTTFATVLELCEGGDLEAHLQQHHTLPEREARALITQVFAGLAYLNRAPNSSSSSSTSEASGFGPRVIHYDLKPANILFDGLGTVKITDFGLSKVVEDGQTMGMELTSQGAGTYWYLPPECFASGSSSSNVNMSASRGAACLLPPGLLSSAAAAAGGGGMIPAAAGGAAGCNGAPKISNKVDVWSAGVILYQMLYGRRPFGEGLTQEQIYRDGVMLNARQVQFPAKPAVSAEGRAFLSRCLAYNQEERWDVITAAADAYLQLRR